MKTVVKYIVFIYFCTVTCWSRIHNLTVKNDARSYISISTFGFYVGGTLEIRLYNFRATPQNESAVFGFSLDKTINDGVNPSLDAHQDHCMLQDSIEKLDNGETVIYFKFDLKNKKIRVICNQTEAVHIYQSVGILRPAPSTSSCQKLDFDMTSTVKDGIVYYNTNFTVAVVTKREEGLYNLFFHNCPNYNQNSETFVDFTMEIVEQNQSNFLSAGDIPLPALYCMMSILFMLSGIFWLFLLHQSKHSVFKIHFLMGILVFLKAISLAFHGVNYHYIEIRGVHLATWAILFYIAHLLKGALLFVVLVLIGTGWTFIKHVLTPRDKRLFMAVIPLQVLANVADIILEESDQGEREYIAWKNFVILVDLLCCVFILFPVVWSIKHLQEASQTDGKAAINLRKLKLFRHFYVMILCYIYSTRMIVYLLKITVPFQYGWLHEMFREMSTYVFFVLTAYKFRPASRNPYFALEDEDDDVEVLTESGATEGLKKVNSRHEKVPLHHHTITEVTEEEKDALLGKESSHEYD